MVAKEDIENLVDTYLGDERFNILKASNESSVKIKNKVLKLRELVDRETFDESEVEKVLDDTLLVIGQQKEKYSYLLRRINSYTSDFIAKNKKLEYVVIVKKNLMDLIHLLYDKSKVVEQAKIMFEEKQVRGYEAFFNIFGSLVRREKELNKQLETDFAYLLNEFRVKISQVQKVKNKKLCLKFVVFLFEFVLAFPGLIFLRFKEILYYIAHVSCEPFAEVYEDLLKTNVRNSIYTNLVEYY